MLANIDFGISDVQFVQSSVCDSGKRMSRDSIKLSAYRNTLQLPPRGTWVMAAITNET